MLTDYSKELEDSTFAKVNELLDEGKADGKVKNIENDLLISYMTGGAIAFVDYLKEMEIPLTEQLIDTAFELCISSIKT